MCLLGRDGAGRMAWLPAGSTLAHRFPRPRRPLARCTTPATAWSAFALTGGHRRALGRGPAQGARSSVRRMRQAGARKPQGIPHCGERRSGACRTSVGGDDSTRMALGERDGQPRERVQLHAALPETAQSTRRAHDRRTNAPESFRRSRVSSAIPIATRPGRRFRRGDGSPCARRAPERSRCRASRAGTASAPGRAGDGSAGASGVARSRGPCLLYTSDAADE